MDIWKLQSFFYSEVLFHSLGSISIIFPSFISSPSDLFMEKMTVLWNRLTKVWSSGNNEDIPSSMILNYSLSPFLTLCKYLGILPFIHKCWGRGKGEMRSCPFFCQISVFCYLIYVGLFIATTAVYTPFYLSVTKSTVNDVTFQVAKYLFVCGQFVSAGVTLILIPRLSQRLSHFLNQLQAVIIDMYELNVTEGRSFYKEIHQRAYLAIFFWLFVTLTSCYLWWNSFHIFILIHFKLEAGSFWYHATIGGCLLLAILISCHVLPSFLFFMLLSFMKGCYKYLCFMHPPIVKTALDFSGQREKLIVAMDLFERLNELVRKLGQIYGRYLIVEMCALFTTLITNLFAVLSGFEEGAVEWQTVCVSLIINITWFYALSESGEAMLKQQGRCLKVLKHQALFSKLPESWVVTKFICVEPLGVSAANYFYISRKLITQVTGVIVMYLIVMLQFKSASKLAGRP